jgi:hypothetical protein
MDPAPISIGIGLRRSFPGYHRRELGVRTNITR